MGTLLRRTCSAVFLLLLMGMHGGVFAQGQSTTTTVVDSSYTKVTPSMAIIIVVLIAALFFMGFFSIYIRHCTNATNDGPGGTIYLGRGSRRGAARGLESSVVETFPIIQYSEVKEHKIGKGALECAVCLNEFEEEETLRLIPKCDHVFHQECIDPWFAAHVTCPVCRANLVPEEGARDGNSGPQISPIVPFELDLETPSSNQDAEPAAVEPTLGRSATRRARSGRLPLRWFPKSHSTGHSLVPPGENTDRFTLRLPEEVRQRIMDRQLDRSRSMAVLPRETSSRRGYRVTGIDGSNGGKADKTAAKLDGTAAKSDRWVFTSSSSFLARASSFLTRASSKSTKVTFNNGEGTSSRPTGSEQKELPV